MNSAGNGHNSHRSQGRRHLPAGSESDPGAPSVFRVRALTFGAAGILAAGLGYDLLHMPLQVSDSLELLLDASASSSAWEHLTRHFINAGYFRPLFYAQNKVVFDLASGHEALAYRLFQAVLVGALILTFVRSLQIRDRVGLFAFPLALSVFLGIHTFLTNVKELYPVNHELEIALCVMIALNLAQSRGGAIVQLASLMTLVVATMILESGVLVGVVLIAGCVAGMPGVTRRTAIVAALITGAYVAWRLGYTETPSIFERSSGFLLSRREPGELAEIFGSNLLPYYLYNVASSTAMLLFSEPRQGVWVFVRDWLDGGVQMSTWVNVTSSMVMTGLIGWYVADRLRSGVRWPLTIGDRQIVVFACVLVANAFVSFGYAKDDIMNPAGACYGVAAFVATEHLLRLIRLRPQRGLLAVALVLVMTMTALSWAARTATVHQVLRKQAFTQRNDWALVEADWERGGSWAQFYGQEALFRRLRREALETRVPHLGQAPTIVERLTDVDY